MEIAPETVNGAIFADVRSRSMPQARLANALPKTGLLILSIYAILKR